MPHLTTRNLKKTWLWIELANSPYAWLHQTSKFHHQTSLLSKILCIFFFALFILCMDIFFNSKRHGNSFMQNSVALHYFKMRLSGAICLLTSGGGGGGGGLGPCGLGGNAKIVKLNIFAIYPCQCFDVVVKEIQLNKTTTATTTNVWPRLTCSPRLLVTQMGLFRGESQCRF